jgi:hypothetical protein
MRLWVEDFNHQLARALRAVGIGLAMVAWASVLGSEAQQSADIRSYAQVVAAVLSVAATQWLSALPPSATLVDLLRPFEREIIAAARERAGGDAARLRVLVGRIAVLAAVRIRRAGNVPRDRRTWFRALAQVAAREQLT